MPAAPPPPAPSSTIFESPESVTRFLATASFGAAPGDIGRLQGTEASDWFLEQLSELYNVDTAQLGADVQELAVGLEKMGLVRVGS